MLRTLIARALLGMVFQSSPPASQPAGVRVLLVVAHPDDDSDFSGSIYKLTHVLGGTVDLCVITNGEGGYRYSTLAEPLYGAKLTDEKTGRALLPSIRKKEAMAGGAIAGVRNFFFLDQLDQAYTQDAHEVLARQWHSAYVVRSLDGILTRNRYEFVFVLIPATFAHGAHQAAAFAALAAVAAQPAVERPAILAGGTYNSKAGPPPFELPKAYPAARLRTEPPFQFDRKQGFGYQDKLDYRIVAGWGIAEHKSQGLLQTSEKDVDVEAYFPFALNDDEKVERTRSLFARLADPTLRP